MAGLHEPQKCSFLKRVSAFLLDFILIVILATGVAFLISVLCNFDSHLHTLSSLFEFYSAKWGVNLQMSQAEYNALSQAQKDAYNAGIKELVGDSQYQGTMRLLFSMSIMIVSLGLFFSVLILEFVVPLFLKDGQTIGKKCFSLAVVKTNSVRINNIQLFVRAILGKYTIELMIPALLIILIYFGFLGLMGTIVVIGILVLNIVLMFSTKFHSLIHDLVAMTVVVDKSTQLFFDDEEALIKYIENNNKEVASKDVYL